MNLQLTDGTDLFEKLDDSVVGNAENYIVFRLFNIFQDFLVLIYWVVLIVRVVLHDRHFDLSHFGITGYCDQVFQFDQTLRVDNFCHYIRRQVEGNINNWEKICSPNSLTLFGFSFRFYSYISDSHDSIQT